jgi:hypothetical protein
VFTNVMGLLQHFWHSGFYLSSMKLVSNA